MSAVPTFVPRESPAPHREAAPRPEYPRPQFEREEWLNLNGWWDFEFDDGRRGTEERWAEGGRRFSRPILVPFCFESPLSGIGDTGFHPRMWYRRSFVIPESWAGRRVLLNFGAVDYRAAVWVNGHRAGEHEGGNTPFRFDITDLLEADGNELTVQVEDPPQDRFIPRGKQHWKETSESIFYKRTSGIWQTVWLEPVAESWLERVRIASTLDGSVTFDATIQNPDPELRFIARVSYKGREVATGIAPADESQAVAAAFVRDPKWWSPSAPELYDVTFELRRGEEVIDRVQSYFGFRSVAVHDGRVQLNGAPLYLRMVLDQGYWPESNLTPPSDEAIQYDIRQAKEMGFNGVRKHQKVEDPRFLYWADRMGLLVSAEMANAYMFDAESVARVTREWIDVMARDCNHPSIIIWVPLNESWGVPDVRDPRQQAHLRAMYMLTRSLDDSRLVIDNDGWEHTGCTDLFAVHDYSQTGEVFLQRFRDLNEGRIPSPCQGKPYLCPGNEYNGAPVFLSEFGGISYEHPDDATKVPENSWGYEGIEKTAEATLGRMRGLYEAIAKTPKVIGICYTQLTDVEQEINGLLTYDRRPKFRAEDIRAINALLR
ncbi:MAG TPA: glycoside hydrolase family 2 TIM barrel-domain containing protein [Bryobacteraceae bacterium]|nr:glycoside hydrolase family 2 TIM barrel-domain containing protein [Bryobacteraceae bacterium]